LGTESIQQTTQRKTKQQHNTMDLTPAHLVERYFDADSEYLKFAHLSTLEYVEVQNTGLTAMAGQT
jgi:hypothetical protein